MRFSLFNMQTRTYNLFKTYKDAQKAIETLPELYGDGSIFEKRK